MSGKQIRPSLIDRLLHAERLDGDSNYFSMVELRESVQSDLQALLNTRVRFLTPPSVSDEVQDTVLNYGLPDMTTLSLVSEQGRRDFSGWIERTIRRYEPRFKNVTVTVGDRHRQRGFRKSEGFVFRVDAILYADPAPESVSFDSLIDPVNQTISLRETHR